jgi:hypothetical protein
MFKHRDRPRIVGRARRQQAIVCHSNSAFFVPPHRTSGTTSLHLHAGRRTSTACAGEGKFWDKVRGHPFIPPALGLLLRPRGSSRVAENHHVLRGLPPLIGE